MKHLNFSKFIIAKIFSVLLAVSILSCSCFILSAASEGTLDDTAEKVMAIQTGSVKSTSFGQSVYLLPDTEYTFSYKYTTGKADCVKIGYCTSATTCTDISKTAADNDPFYNMDSYTFKTVSLDTEGVLKDGTETKIKCFIGIGFWMINSGGWKPNPKYNNGAYKFGDFILTKNTDETNTNLFYDPLMGSFQTKVNDTAVWGALNRGDSSQIAAWNFARFKEEGKDYTTRGYFKKSFSIKIDDASNGKVSATSDKAGIGDKIYINATPNNGYKVLELTANGIPVPNISGVYTLDVSKRILSGKENITLHSRFCQDNTYPSFKIFSSPNVPLYFVQTVYLEPETEYVFSYKYSNKPADWENITPSTGSVKYTVNPNRIYDDKYKMITRTFTTSSLDATGVTVGTGINEGLIQSNIGLAFSSSLSSEYLNGNSLFADYTLYKKEDINHTNLFTTLDFSDIYKGNNSSWHNTNSTPVNYYFAMFDSDSSIDGFQNPSSSLFLNTTHKIVKDSESIENGTISVSSSAQSGDVVNAVVTPNEGYWLKGVTVSSNNCVVTKNDDGSFGFKMPDENVIIYAGFKKNFLGDVNDDDKVNLLDLIRLNKYIKGVTKDIVLENSKIFNKTDIGNSDVCELIKMILNGVDSNMEFDKTSILNNTVYRLNVQKKLNIAYFGGSVTVGYKSSNMDENCYRALTTAWFRKNYPNANIVENNAAIGSTGTEIGMHRAVTDLKLQDDSLKPDLTFVEFAINDLYDSRTSDEAKVNLETIINTIYKYAPSSDIVLLFTTDLSRKGTEYNIIQAQKEIAEEYKLPYISIGSNLWNEIVKENNQEEPEDIKNNIWNKYFADIVHPTDIGHEKYSQYITTYLGKVLHKDDLPKELVNSFKPESPYNNLVINPTSSNFKGQQPPTGLKVDVNGYISNTSSECQFTFKFKGTALQLWSSSTPFSGDLNFVFDGKDSKKISLYSPIAQNKTFNVIDGLTDSEHTVTVTLSKSYYGSDLNIKSFLISGSLNSDGVHFDN